jgi:hypothetical protein
MPNIVTLASLILCEFLFVLPVILVNFANRRDTAGQIWQKK